MSVSWRYCSLIPGLGVKLSNDILAGPTVLSAVDKDQQASIIGSMKRRSISARPTPPFAVRHQFLFALAVVSFSITSLTLKLAVFVRGGNSLKLSSHCVR